MPPLSVKTPEFLVLAGAVLGELGHHLGVVDRKDEVRRVARGSARVGHRALVNQDQVAPTETGQVTGEAVANDAGTDDDGAGPGVLLRSCWSFLPFGLVGR